MFRVASFIGLRTGQAFRARFISMAGDLDNIKTRPYRTIGEAVTWSFIAPVRMNSPARGWLVYFMQKGVKHVRPLAGGLQGWRARGFPVSSPVVVTPVTRAAGAN